MLEPTPAPGTDGKETAWTERDLADPHASAEKASKVRRMFAAIAARYDLNNRLHSFGRDQAWRRYAVRAATVREGDLIVDVACGTGDLTEAFARSPAQRVIGIDFTPEMLAVAERKRARLPDAVRRRISYRAGDAQALDLPDTCADVVSIAFGIRNVAEPGRAVREFARVLKPGGRLVILEFDRPRLAPVRWLNDLYSGWLMPRTATLISGDRSGAYRYLPRSVGTFMTREELVTLIGASGFDQATVRPLTMGICACYRAVRTGPR
jgi:demethylmenaquinone methyltransferase/2-methoxy-6-polyprenyl-1,4-benzoquinol methylase